MKTVWKYKLTPERGTPVCKFAAPYNGKILMVGAQEDSIYAWIEIDTDNDYLHHNYEVYIYGTGHEISNYDYEFIEHLNSFFYV